jgi:ferrous iron transport protein A
MVTIVVTTSRLSWLEQDKMLTQLGKGQAGCIKQVTGGDALSLRLMEMGLVPGVEIRCLGSAPFGGPLEFELLGFRISLRRSECQRIILHEP